MDFDATAVARFYVESSSGSHNFYRNQTGAIEAVAATVFGVAHVGNNQTTAELLVAATCVAWRTSVGNQTGSKTLFSCNFFQDLCLSNL
jgi:5-keto 4-deoxyuronate isomerase